MKAIFVGGHYNGLEMDIEKAKALLLIVGYSKDWTKERQNGGVLRYETQDVYDLYFDQEREVKIMGKLTSIFKSSFDISDLTADEYNVIDAIEHSDELDVDYLEIGAYRLYLKNSEVFQIETGEYDMLQIWTASGFEMPNLYDEWA